MKTKSTFKILILFFLSLCTFPTLNAQVCYGDVTLSSQEQVDAFNCTSITGNLRIVTSLNSITDLSPLSSLTSIGGYLLMQNLDVVNLNGLNNLGSIGGDLSIVNLDNLTNIDALSTLSSVGDDIAITGNLLLEDLDGLSGLTSVSGLLKVTSNQSLTNINGLSSITTIGEYCWIDGAALMNYDGLSSLTSIGMNLTILNTGLTNIDGLSSLVSIGHTLYINGNDDLTNLNGLSSLNSIGGSLDIRDNDALTNIDGLSLLTTIGDGIRFEGNASLANLDGLSSLTTSDIGSLVIMSNPSLLNIDGLSSISSVNYAVQILYNNALINLDGLSSLSSINGEFLLQSNPALSNINGLSSLASIGGLLKLVFNNALTNLDGFYSLTSVGGNLNITYNDVLESFCGLFPLINGGGLIGFYSVYSNTYNPSPQDIINDGPCLDDVYCPKMTVYLRDSNGNLLAGGSLTYYKDGEWLQALEILDGVFCVDPQFKKVSLKMEYENRVLLAYKVPSNTDFTFQTKLVTIELRKSDGSLGHDGGVVTYGSAKYPFGTTGDNGSGIVTKELLPMLYRFDITYLSGCDIVYNHDISDNPTITFYTTEVTVGLWDYLIGGTIGIDGGVITHRGCDGYTSFGTTGDDGTGIVKKDLLNAVYDFKILYNNDQDKILNHDIVADPTVDFNLDDLKSTKVEKESNTDLELFPNPFSENTTIAFGLEKSEEVTLSVFDINGKLIETIHQGHLQEGKHKIQWNTSDLQNGIYILRLTTMDGLAHQNIVKM